MTTLPWLRPLQDATDNDGATLNFGNARALVVYHLKQYVGEIRERLDQEQLPGLYAYCLWGLRMTGIVSGAVGKARAETLLERLNQITSLDDLLRTVTDPASSFGPRTQQLLLGCVDNIFKVGGYLSTGFDEVTFCDAVSHEDVGIIGYLHHVLQQHGVQGVANAIRTHDLLSLASPGIEVVRHDDVVDVVTFMP